MTDDNLDDRVNVIPKKSLSQNEIDRMHWAKKHQHREEWYWLVRGCVGDKTEREKRKMHVEITRVSKRLIDELNIASGCKWLLDAFVQYGWLYDDAPKWATVTTRQRKCLKDEEEHMEVVLSPI